jgi:predicted small lipoprotein YifL
MKKAWISLLVLAMAAALAACGGGAAPAEPPASPAEALQLFNEATEQAVKRKPGYSKTRYSKVTQVDFGVLSNLQTVREAAYGFFGVGSDGEGTASYTVKKGESSSLLRASAWILDDIESAEAEPDGAGGYVVTVKVKGGTTRWSGEGGGDPGSGTAKSAIDGGPLCYGEDDSPDYDHKTALNLYYTINRTEGASTKDIGETVTGVEFTAKIDSKGRLTQLTGRLDMRVDVYHVQYSLFTLRDNAGEGYGEVTYSDFKY